MKRILTFLLVVVLLLSYVPATHVHAEDSLLPAPDGESVEPKITEPVEPETPVPSEPIALEPIGQEEPEETEPIELEEPQPTEPEVNRKTEANAATWGDNLTWTLDDNGLLTISGVGEMWIHGQYDSAPGWRYHPDAIIEVVIEEGVTTIAPEAFQKCKNLRKVTLPKSLTYIGDRAFQYCELLTDINFEEGLIEIDSSAFECCYRLKQIILPDSLQIIGVKAFNRCDSVRELKLGNNVTTIGMEAFRQCGVIESLIIPDSVTEIGNGAFASLSDLKEVKISNGLTKISNRMLYGCVSLKSIEIPSGITQIEDEAFNYCKSVTTFVVPDGVTSIGKEAFGCCFVLHTIVIPASANQIASNVFLSSKALETVYYGGTKTQWNSFQIKAEKAKVHFDVDDVKAHARLTKHIAPTCKKTGRDTYKCICGYSWSVNLPKEHDWQYTKTVAPTCGEFGYDLETCSACKATRKTKSVPINITIRHTCVDGKCTVCGERLVYTPTVGVEWEYDGKPRISAVEDERLKNFDVYRASSKNGPYTKLNEEVVTRADYWDKSAEPGKYYYYKVRSVENGYTSKMSNPKKVLCKLDMPASATLDIDSVSGKPIISWEAAEGATKYYLYRATSQYGKFSKIKTVTDTTFTDKTAKPGKVYYYAIRSAGKYAAASSNMGILEGGVPVGCAQPAVKVTIEAATGKPVLTWKKVSGAVMYAVYSAASEEEELTLLGTTKSCKYKDTGVPANSQRYYVVLAVSKNENGISIPSVPVMVHVPCAQVSIKTANDTLTGKPVITWSPVEKAMEYEVFRSTSKKGAYTSLGTTEDASFCDASAVAGKTYYYKVCAIDASGAAGAQSSYKSILCKAAQPQIQVALDENGKPAISWEAAEGAVKYEVYRATSLNGKYSKKTTVKTLSYVDTSAKNGTTYYYRVVAVPVSSKAKSSPSQSVAITVPWYV